MWTMCSTAFRRRIGPLLLIAVLATVFIGLYPRDHAIAWGALLGGLGGMSAMLLLRLRRNQDGTLTRAMRGTADERDLRITWEAGMWTAIAMQAACVLGLVALVWHLNAMVVLGGVLWTGLIAQYGSYLILQRKR